MVVSSYRYLHSQLRKRTWHFWLDPADAKLREKNRRDQSRDLAPPPILSALWLQREAPPVGPRAIVFGELVADLEFRFTRRATL